MRIYPNMASRFRQTRFPLPCLSEISRDKQCEAVLVSRCRVQNLRICGIDSQGRNHSQGIRLREDILVGMVGVHGNTFDVRWLGIHQVPTLSAIGTAPQASGLRVHSLGVHGVENKEAYDAPQIKHPPGTPAVMRDVSARHIAGNQHSVDIVRADGGMEHRSAAARTDDTKITRSSGESITQANENDDSTKAGESSPDPFFSLHIFDR